MEGRHVEDMAEIVDVIRSRTFVHQNKLLSERECHDVDASGGDRISEPGDGLGIAARWQVIGPMELIVDPVEAGNGESMPLAERECKATAFGR